MNVCLAFFSNGSCCTHRFFSLLLLCSALLCSALLSVTEVPHSLTHSLIHSLTHSLTSHTVTLTHCQSKAKAKGRERERERYFYKEDESFLYRVAFFTAPQIKSDSIISSIDTSNNSHHGKQYKLH